jgi:hypothetical protein
LSYVARIQFPGLKLPLPFQVWLGNRLAVSSELLRTLEMYKL